jgi:hypothetical protein
LEEVVTQNSAGLDRCAPILERGLAELIQPFDVYVRLRPLGATGLSVSEFLPDPVTVIDDVTH